MGFIVFILTILIFFCSVVFTFKTYNYLNFTDTFFFNEIYYYNKTVFPLKLGFVKNEFSVKYNLNTIIDAINKTTQTINEQTKFNFFIGPVQLLTGIYNDTNIDTISYLLDTVKIQFVAKKHNVHESFDGKGSVLAHATLPPFKTLCLDAEESWNKDVLISVLLHEFGHILGLRHPDNMTVSSIMNNPMGMFYYQKYDLITLKKAYPWIMI